MFRDLRDIALSVNLAARFSIASGGHILATDFDLTADGEVPFAALTGKILHVRSLRLTGAYDGTRNHLSLAQADLNAKEAIAYGLADHIVEKL